MTTSVPTSVFSASPAILAPDGLAAYYGPGNKRSVVAFDKDGYALVVDYYRGCLVRAQDVNGFQSLSEA
jgi:hypothetical protein